MSNIQHLWSTPIEQGTFDHQLLLNHLLSTTSNNKDSNERDNNIFACDHKIVNNFHNQALADFTKYAKQCFNVDITDFQRIILKGWVANTTGDYSMAIHNHKNSQLSSVYYVLADDGDIVFADPRTSCNRGYGNAFNDHFSHHTISPKPGMFVMFPSYLWHYVKPSNKLRICVIVDLFLRQ